MLKILAVKAEKSLPFNHWFPVKTTGGSNPCAFAMNERNAVVLSAGSAHSK